MHLITEKTLREFYETPGNEASKDALVNWAARVKKATWHSLAEIKRDYASVDYVGNDRYVFNIHGNQFRLVVLIFMVRQKVYVRWVGRHKDYDKIDCKTI